jgi:hypothetical protein
MAETRSGVARPGDLNHEWTLMNTNKTVFEFAFLRVHLRPFVVFELPDCLENLTSDLARQVFGLNFPFDPRESS